MAVHFEMYDEQYHTSELLGIALSNGEETLFYPGMLKHFNLMLFVHG